MMFDLVKKTALAAAIAFAMVPTGASAATINLTDGVTINPLDPADVYIYEEALVGAGGADSRIFTFVADSADTPLSAVAGNVTMTLSGSISGVFMEWFDGVTTTAAAFAPINPGLGFSAALSTLFTSPNNLTQTLTVGWSSYTGPVQISMQVVPVPLPAGGLLLLGALGGLAALRRRRKAA